MDVQLLPDGNLRVIITPEHPDYGRLRRAHALVLQGKPLPPELAGPDRAHVPDHAADLTGRAGR